MKLLITVYLFRLIASLFMVLPARPNTLMSVFYRFRLQPAGGSVPREHSQLRAARLSPDEVGGRGEWGGDDDADEGQREEEGPAEGSGRLSPQPAVLQEPHAGEHQVCTPRASCWRASGLYSKSLMLESIRSILQEPHAGEHQVCTPRASCWRASGLYSKSLMLENIRSVLQEPHAGEH